MVKHVVLVCYHPQISSDIVTAQFQQLAELTRSIPGLVDFVGGPNCSNEGLSAGYTHGFVMTFATVAARDAYLIHPDHEQVKDAILPTVQSVLVFDFEVPSAS